jgi:hypothetical protein
MVKKFVERAGGPGLILHKSLRNFGAGNHNKLLIEGMFLR